MFILIESAIVNNKLPKYHRYLMKQMIDKYKNNIAQQSLNKRSTKIEWIRLWMDVIHFYWDPMEIYRTSITLIIPMPKVAFGFLPRIVCTKSTLRPRTLCVIRQRYIAPVKYWFLCWLHSKAQNKSTQILLDIPEVLCPLWVVSNPSSHLPELLPLLEHMRSNRFQCLHCRSREISHMDLLCDHCWVPYILQTWWSTHWVWNLPRPVS